MISIAMTTYNGARFVESQINSILNQTIADIEIIICDDNSMDDCVEIIQKIQTRDTRVKLIQNKEKIGVVRNFEKAIAACQGSFIALCDQDDVWSPNKLEVQLNQYVILRQKELIKPIVLSHDLTLMDQKCNIEADSMRLFLNFKENTSLRKKIIFNTVTGCTLFFDSYTAKRLIPFIDYKLMHDHQIAIFSAVFGISMRTEDKLVLFRRHDQNQTSTRKNSLKERFKIFLKEIKNEDLFYSEIEFCDRFLNQYEREMSFQDRNAMQKIVNLKTKSPFYRKLYSIYLNYFVD